MRKLVDNVLQWGYDKGLVPGKWQKQFGKMQEEVEEFYQACLTGDKAQQKDELGDVLVTAIITGATLDIDVEDALASAYAKISKRKGKTIDGVFVKDE